MKRNFLLAVCLSASLIAPITGCRTVTANTPPAALAPGYNSAADQKVGQDLAAVNGFIAQEKLNYVNLTPQLQAAEKSYLNTLIDSANVANAIYVKYHQGTQTLEAAQSALVKAQSDQSALTANKGVK